jgi:hypothetical protein
VILSLIAVASGPTFAQDSDPAIAAPTTTAGATIPALRIPTVFSATAQSSFPARTVHRCCSRKGAIIGASVGAALGFWLVTQGAYDTPGCGIRDVALIGTFGGLGALVGAFAEHQPDPASHRALIALASAPGSHPLGSRRAATLSF